MCGLAVTFPYVWFLLALPWIAIFLAGTCSAYALVKKTTSLEALPALALETAGFLRKLRDPVAKARVQEVYLQLLIPFVRDGIVRLYGLRASSKAASESKISSPKIVSGSSSS